MEEREERAIYSGNFCLEKKKKNTFAEKESEQTNTRGPALAPPPRGGRLSWALGLVH